MKDQPKPDTSILVAEVTGDAPLLGKLGAMETQRAVERCRNRAERSIGAYEGFTLQANGRALVAHFPRADSAALAALDLRERVRQLPPVSGVTLTIRAAIHVGRLDSAGQPVETAIAATQDQLAGARAGQILVSQEAADELPDILRLNLQTETGARSGDAVLSLHAASASTEDEDAVQTVVLPAAASGEALQPPAESAPRNSMMLRHGRSTLIVSEARPIILTGREDGNDIVIVDRRASRHHARIEWRKGGFVLIDSSTNGSFLVDEDGAETALRRAETPLPARGRIGFGYSPEEPDAEQVFFDIGAR